MTDQRELDRLLGTYFVEGTNELADRVIDAALDQIDRTEQRHPLRVPWRSLTMNRFAQLAAGAAMVAVIGASVIFLAGRPDPNGVVGASPTPGAQAAPSDTPSPTLEASQAPTASSAPTPSPTGPIASSIDPVALLRVNIETDTGAPRYPSLTVYRDGTVLSQDGRMARLTPAGLAQVLSTASDSNLFVASGDLGFEPGYVGGGARAVIELRRGDDVIRRSTPLATAVATRAEADRIIALAEHLVDLESWLPADAWATKPSADTMYVPTDYVLTVTVEKDRPGEGHPLAVVDIADIDWPLAGRLQDFGEPQPDPGLGVGSSARCGTMTLAESIAVQRALAEAPLARETVSMRAVIDWAAAGSHVTVGIYPLLPEDPHDCTVGGLIYG